MAMKKVFGVSSAPQIEVRQEGGRIVFTKTPVVSSPHGNEDVPSRTFPSCIMFDLPMSAEWNYFEIRILEEGDLREIGIGIGPSNYDLLGMPGWDNGSIGYHADNGGVFNSSGAVCATGFRECYLNDVMGCGVDYSSRKHGYVTVWFTRNGELAGPPEKIPLPKDGLYPLIGMSCWRKLIRTCYFGHSCASLPYTEEPPALSVPRVFPQFTTVWVDYPYEARLPDELTLSPGDVVEVTNWDFESRPKWAKGRIRSTGEEGLFYTDFVRPTFPQPAYDRDNIQGYIDLYGGREYVFADKPEEWLECVICKELAYEPHLSTCCGHMLCLKCATRWKERSDSCVACRQEPLELQRDTRAELILSGLAVGCPNARHGCEWKGTLGGVEPHLDTTCVFGYLNKEFTPDSIVDCPCCACSVVDKATQKKLSCGRMKYYELFKYHYKTCSDWPMRCPNGCPDPLTRASLPVHLGVDCPEEIVSCDFSSMGCTYCSKRREMKKHVVEDVAQHLNVLLSDHMRVSEQLKRVTLELDQTKAENAKLHQQQTILSDELERVKDVKGAHNPSQNYF